jgi:hypothetical protein
VQDEITERFCLSEKAIAELPRTASVVARELGRSVTCIKQLARQIHAPVLRTPTGIWIFPQAAVEKLRAEIRRRENEDLRR